MNQAARTPQRNRAILPATEPESPEERRLRARIEALRSDVTSTAAELEELRVTLQAFEARYDASIGVLIVALDRVSLENVRLVRTLEALLDTDESLEEIERAVNREFEEEQQRLEDEAREAAGATNRLKSLAPPPAEDVALAIRSQYRKLARQFHPDVAVTDDQRAHNELAMKRINEAMENHDLDALHVLEASLPARSDGMPGGSSRAKVRWATQEIERLEMVLTRKVGQVAAVKASSLYALWLRCESERGALDRLAKDLKDELTLARMEQRSLTQTLDERRRARSAQMTDKRRHG